MTTIVEIDTETDPVKRDALVEDLRKLIPARDLTLDAPKSAIVAELVDAERPAEPEAPPATKK